MTRTPHERAGSRLDHLGSALRWLRHRRDWTQEKLARKANVTPSMVSNYESRKELPRLETLDRLLTALGADWADLEGALATVAGREEGIAAGGERARSSEAIARAVHHTLEAWLRTDLEPRLHSWTRACIASRPPQRERD